MVVLYDCTIVYYYLLVNKTVQTLVTLELLCNSVVVYINIRVLCIPIIAGSQPQMQNTYCITAHKAHVL